MRDTFQVSGDEVYFGPWLVATLDKRMPPTVRERVLMELDCLDCEGQITELVKEHEEELRAVNVTNAEEIARLEKEIERLNGEVESAADMRDDIRYERP